MPAILSLLLRYLPQLIGAVLVIGLYFWWRGEIVSETEDRVTEVFKAREAKIRWESQAELDKKNREIELIKQHQSTVYIGAIENYAKEIINLNDQLVASRDKRLFVTTRTSCSNNTLPAKAGSTKADSGRREELYQSELEPEITRALRENAAEVERGKLACAELVRIVENSMLVKGD